MSTIGNRIKRLRENAGLTQRELADKFNIGYSTFSQYESGQRTPSDDVKILLANYFGVSVDYLLGNNPPKKDALTQKEKTDIAKEVQAILDDLSDDKPMFELDGKIIDDEIKEILRSSLQNTIEFARLKAKEKYTPKKYKK